MKYDILSILEKSSTIKAEAGRISARKNSEIQRYGVRRFENNKIFQTSRLGSVGVERLITDTREWGGPGIDHGFGFAPEKKESRVGAKVAPEVLKDYESCLQQLKSQYPDYVFSGQCIIKNLQTSFSSSYGVDLKTSGDFCEWYFVYQRKDSGNVIDGFLSEVTARPNLHDSIQEHLPFLNQQRKEISLQNGKLPVLLIESTTPLKKLIESFHVQKYSEGAALYSGRLGDSLFDSRVNLLDSAYDPERGQIQFFDGEGSVRKSDHLSLIENGRFMSLMSDLRFGKKYSRSSTGNGLRAYNRGVTLSPHSLRFSGGRKTWQEIVKGLDRCLVAFLAVGGESNDLGEFSSPVQIGYVMEKGEVIGRAQQLTVKTSVERYLKSDLIDISSNGFTASSPSSCVISEMDVLV